MQAIDAVGAYFDGLTAKAHPVTLRLTDRLEIVGREIGAPPIRLSWDLFDLAAGDTAPPVTRIGPHGGAARVEFADDALAVALAARCPDLHRPEARDAGSRWRIALWSIAAGISVLLLAAYGVPAIASRLAPLIPASLEARLGASVETQIGRLLSNPPRCEDAPASAVLARLVARLSEGGALPAEALVSVRKHGTANALTLPGGRVVVLSDLIDQAKTPDEFAGVLAHEIGHVAARDPMRGLLAASGTSFLLSLVLGDLTGSTIVVAMGQAMISAGYSRQAETAADAYSVAVMLRAGGDATALATILERIAKDKADDGAAFLRSHPFTAERARAIRALAGPDSVGRHILDEADWQRLRRICGPAATSEQSPI